jgi:hypothetical protein
VPPWAWATALEETAVFAFILHFGPVGDPLKLWDDLKDGLCDDLPYAIDRFVDRLERPDLAFPDAHGLFDDKRVKRSTSAMG